jgi:5-methylcytosine-specific restriction endonuclease McrA
VADDEDTPSLPEIISRKDAIAKGLTRYFTGEPCKNGHICFRWTQGTCSECQKLFVAAKRDKIREYQNEYRRRNHEKMLAQERARHAAKPEIQQKAAAKYRAANIEKDRDRVRAYRAANLEKLKARQKERYAADPEKYRECRRRYEDANPTKAAERRQRLKLENPEKHAERVAHLNAWKAANPERAKAAAAAYRRANIDQHRTYHANRKARKRAGGTHTVADIGDLLRLQKCKCAICKTSIRDRYHIDHITPLARGGSNVRANLQLLCPPCNHRKSDRDPIEHMQSLGLLL